MYGTLLGTYSVLNSKTIIFLIHKSITGPAEGRVPRHSKVRGRVIIHFFTENFGLCFDYNEFQITWKKPTSEGYNLLLDLNEGYTPLSDLMREGYRTFYHAPCVVLVLVSTDKICLSQ